MKKIDDEIAVAKSINYHLRIALWQKTYKKLMPNYLKKKIYKEIKEFHH